MAITYSIAIDYNDDGDFTDAGDNITEDILSAEWHLGMASPYASASTIASAIIVVRNPARDYSPEVSGNLIGKSLRIQSDDGTTVRTHFRGFIERVEPQTGKQGTQMSRIIAQGRELELQQQQVRLPFQTDVRADEALSDILAQINWRYAVLDGMCIIGRDSIGSSDIFPDEAFASTLDSGKSTFAFLSDNRADGLPADEAIRQLAEGEGGRFFFDRRGDAHFYHRHHLIEDDAVVASFDNDMADLVYDYGGVINAIEATMIPRSIGAGNTRIWSLSSALKLERESAFQIIARYEVDDEAVGAIEVIAPQPDIHFKAYASPNNTLDDMTADFQVVIVEQTLSALVLEIRNRSTQRAYLTQLDIHGTPLISGDAVTLTEGDAMSIALYGKHLLQMNLPVITDSEEARNIIAWLLQRRSSPQGIVRELHTNTRNHPAKTLSLTLFDRIRIQETQTGHDVRYHIVAEHHLVDKGGTRHQVQWLVEPSDSEFFFIIGTHSIGDEVVLVPR